MANLSDAHGSFELVGNWNAKHIKAWTYLIYTQNYGYYSNILDEECFEDLYKGLKKEKVMTFSATGRWAYSTNLEQLWQWAQNEELFQSANNSISNKNQITYRQYINRIKWLIEEMNRLDLCVEWDYYDAECGAGFLVHMTGWHKSIFNSDKNKYELMYWEGEQESWDPNLKNMCEQFYDYDYSELYVIEDILERLYVIPEKNKQDLHNLIVKDPNWYNLSGWPFIEEIEQVPEKLQQDITKRLKGEVPWS